MLIISDLLDATYRKTVGKMIAGRYARDRLLVDAIKVLNPALARRDEPLVDPACRDEEVIREAAFRLRCATDRCFWIMFHTHDAKGLAWGAPANSDRAHTAREILLDEDLSDLSDVVISNLMMDAMGIDEISESPVLIPRRDHERGERIAVAHLNRMGPLAKL